jgi:hypothetical protein
VFCLCISTQAYASTLFVANLNGAQDSVATPAVGFGTVLLNNAQDTITVDMSFTGLIGGPAAAAHIHCCALPGANAPVVFPFSGVPAATSGSIPEQMFAITAAQVASLEAGLMYMNIHDAEFPGGEIRGQLLAATPEPSSIGLIGLGLVGLGIIAKRRQRA